jgi:hypothetical protein
MWVMPAKNLRFAQITEPLPCLVDSRHRPTCCTLPHRRTYITSRDGKRKPRRNSERRQADEAWSSEEARFHSFPRSSIAWEEPVTVRTLHSSLRDWSLVTG